MEKDLIIRLRITRAGLRRWLALALFFLLPAHLLSQGDPGRSIVINTSYPAPVGAFSELQVVGPVVGGVTTGATRSIELARNGGRIGIGNLGAGVGVPAAGFTVAGSASFGANSAPPGAEPLNLFNNAALGTASGLSMDDQTVAGRWVIYPNQIGGSPYAWINGMQALLFWNSTSGDTFGIDSGGSLHACTWNANACPGNTISMLHGPGGPGNITVSCADPLGRCAPPPNAGSWHYCCNMHF